MKVVVVLCAVLLLTGRPLLTGPWLLNSIVHWQHSLQGTSQKWTDLSHHAQLSMCTSRDKMAASGMEFSVLIECEFVAVFSWKVGWLWFFYTKFALVRSDDWWVSFTRPWAVYTRLGRPDEWLVRTLRVYFLLHISLHCGKNLRRYAKDSTDAKLKISTRSRGRLDILHVPFQ